MMFRLVLTGFASKPRSQAAARLAHPPDDLFSQLETAAKDAGVQLQADRR